MGLKKGTQVHSPFESYTVVRALGSGGAGDVYQVSDPDGTQLALKVLNAERAKGSKLRRFRNEIYFCQKNLHPNIVQVLDVGLIDDKAPFYVMPLYSGTLRSLIRGAMTEPEILPLFGQILDAIEVAHLRNVWHRDLKPENILSSLSDKKLVVADFGIAHFEEDQLLTLVATEPAERLANFAYAAPEQRAIGEAVTGKSDVYSLGLILNEMFTKHLAIGIGYTSIAAISPNYGYLDPLVEKMLSASPDSRPTIQGIKKELIARGNEFLSLQRLDSLRSRVVPETDVDDPIVKNPMSVVSVDFENGLLVFTLNATPSPKWIAAFQGQQVRYGHVGFSPDRFTFHGNTAVVPMPNEMSAQVLVDNAKLFTAVANETYTRQVEAEHHSKLQRERDEIKREITAQERRKTVLSSITL
jgi:serine/threonine protein kinase